MPTYTAPTLPINTEEKFQQGIDFITNATPSTTNPPIKKGLIASMLDYAKKTNKIPDYTPGETVNKDEVRYYELGGTTTLKSNWEEVDLSDYKVIQCEQLEEGGHLYTTEEILATDDKLILVYNIISSSYNYGRIIINNSNAYEVGTDIGLFIQGIGIQVELLNITEMSVETFVNDYGLCENFITNGGNVNNYFYYQGKYLKLLSCPYSQEPYEASTEPTIKGIWRSEIDENTEAPSISSENWKLIADVGGNGSLDLSNYYNKSEINTQNSYSTEETLTGVTFEDENGVKKPIYRKMFYLNESVPPIISYSSIVDISGDYENIINIKTKARTSEVSGMLDEITYLNEKSTLFNLIETHGQGDSFISVNNLHTENIIFIFIILEYTKQQIQK